MTKEYTGRPVAFGLPNALVEALMLETRNEQMPVRTYRDESVIRQPLKQPGREVS